MSDDSVATYQPTSRRLRRFLRRFGARHLEFACHAALPLALTPDLLYRLWKLFGLPNGAPWIAVSDFLLSDLCEPVGFAGEELFEMRQDERAELLQLLEASFGRARVDEVAHFVFDYALRLLDSDTPGVSDVAYAQRWTAQTFVEPAQAARELTRSLAGHVAQHDIDEVARVTALIELSSERLAAFPDLLDYARGILARYSGDETEALARLERFGSSETVTVAGERTPLPGPPTIEAAPQPGITMPLDRMLVAEQRNILQLDLREEGATQYRVYANGSLGSATALTPSPAVDEIFVRYTPAQIELSARNIRAIGAPLYRALFADAVAALYRRTRATLPPDEPLLVALHVEPEDSRLAAFPWEFAADPEAGRQSWAGFSLARVIAQPLKPHLPDRPLHVLVTMAKGDPAGVVDHLRQYGDALRLTVRTYPDLALLRQDLYAGVDIWHHIGDLAEYAGQATLPIRNRSGELEPRSPVEIADLVSLGPPLLVILQGVLQSTAGPEPVELPSSLAAMLVRAGAAACLTLQFELTPDQHQVLAQTFYDRLLTGAPIGTCVAAARRALAASADPYAAAAPSLTVASAGLTLTLAPGEVDRARLAHMLLDAAFARRDSIFRRESPFHRYALANNLGFPLAAARQVSIGGMNYELQLFARETLYRMIADDANASLRELEPTDVFDVRPLRELAQIDAFQYAALLEHVFGEFVPDIANDLWLRTALRDGLGMPLGPRFSLALESGSHTIQAFALDALVDWQTETYDIFRASGLAGATTAQETRLGAAVLAEVYRRQGIPYHPEWAAHRIAVTEGLGLPLSDVLHLTIDGLTVHAQIFAADVVYVVGAPWETATENAIGRLSQLVSAGLLAELTQPPSATPFERAALNRDFVMLEEGVTIAEALARLPDDRAARAATYILIPAAQERYIVARWDEIEQAVLRMRQTK